MQGEGRALVALAEEEESREQPAALDELRHALAPRAPQPPRKRAQEGALVDDIERRFGDRGEEIVQANVAGVRPEDRPRRAERLGAEIDPEHIPPAFGEETHVPCAAASGNEHLARSGRSGHERAKLGRHLPRVPRREARAVAQVPEFGGRGVALGKRGRAHAGMVSPNRYTSRCPRLS
jgi:hypothetical protein